AVKLSSQSSVVSLSSSHKKTSVQPLTSTVTCLHCTKQLKERRILCTHSVIYMHCFHCTQNNDSCLSV
ncbi:hypothetical protein EMPG_14139, partial [Blastomyces silverae]